MTSLGEKDALRNKITAESFWNTDLDALEPKGITRQVISIDGIPLVTLPLENHPASNTVITQVKSSINELFKWFIGK